MSKLIDKFDMQTNFEGLIKLLAKNLYSEPNVFIRELIQNSHDSIVRRMMEKRELKGYIDIFTSRTENKIIISDNGIGMDEKDIRRFLSVIGSTGTGTTKEQLKDKGLDLGLIGQFGIGMLSAFVVANKVIVKTKKQNNESLEWHNSGSMECSLYKGDKQETGTEIHIYINNDYEFVLDEDFIRETIRKYCDFIQFPINVNNNGTANIMNAPWHKIEIKNQGKLINECEIFLRRRYRELVLEVIPVNINDVYKCKGALYISDSVLPDITSSGMVDIFVRRMFIRSSDKEMLPPWAKFIQGIIDSPDLKPTAARDNIQRNEAAYEFIQSKLGDIIVNHLTKLAETNPKKFQKINELHHYHIKGMAAAHRFFFEKIGMHLLFDTNKGLLSLNQIIEQTKANPEKANKKPIYYFSSRNSSSQFYSLGKAKDWIVINASSIFEEPLIEKFVYFNSDKVYAEQLDTSDDPNLFERLDANEEEHFQLLELEFESILKNMGLDKVKVRTRKYDPSEIPAIIINNAETEAEQKLKLLMNEINLMGFDDIASEAVKATKNKPVFLSLNANNLLIKTLATTQSYKNMRKPIRNEVIGSVYNSALLFARDTLKEENFKEIHQQFVRLIELVIQELNT